MPKITISQMLGYRKKVRIFTIFAGFALVALLFQMWVFNNPKGSKAALSWSNDKLVMNGQFYVDNTGNIFNADPQASITNENQLITNQDVIVDTNSTVSFMGGTVMGGTVPLKSMQIKNGAKVTHFGPGPNVDNLSSMRDSYFAAKFEGYLKAPMSSSYQPIYMELQGAAARLEVWEAGGTQAQVPVGSYYGLPSFNYTAGAYYKYRVSFAFKARVSDLGKVIFTTAGYSMAGRLFGNYNGSVGTDPGKAYFTYYIPDITDVDNLYNSGPNLVKQNPDTLFNKVFSVDYLNSPRFLGDLTAITGEPYPAPGLYFGGGTPWALPDSSWQTTGLGINRKLDLNISGDLTIDTGGKIDVTGKGYASDSGTGKGASTYGDAGGGGGYGGRGGQGVHHGNQYNPGVSGGTTYSSAINPEELGSGGGNGVLGPGGAGGGLVKIVANNITLGSSPSIIASGDDGIGSPGGGGGSGGAINLQAERISGSPNNPILQARGGKGAVHDHEMGGSGGGGRVYVQAGGVNVGSAIFENIIDIDWGWPVGWTPNNWIGLWPAFQSTGGERGTAVVTAGSLADSKVKKILFPHQRPYGTANANFNPYALQFDDVIRVEITVGDVVANVPLTVNDYWIRLPDGSMQCEPIANDGSYPASPGSAAGWPTNSPANPVGWSYSPVSDGNVTFSYYCRVK